MQITRTNNTGLRCRVCESALKEINEWWNLIQEDFKRLNQNYQDYLRDFYSGKADRLMIDKYKQIHSRKRAFRQEIEELSKSCTR